MWKRDDPIGWFQLCGEYPSSFERRVLPAREALSLLSRSKGHLFSDRLILLLNFSLYGENSAGAIDPPAGIGWRGTEEAEV